MTRTTTPRAIQKLPVFRAQDFVVTDGVAEGDAISIADDLVLDDVYQLSDRAERRNLSVIEAQGGSSFDIAPVWFATT